MRPLVARGLLGVASELTRTAIGIQRFVYDRTDTTDLPGEDVSCDAPRHETHIRVSGVPSSTADQVRWGLDYIRRHHKELA